MSEDDLGYSVTEKHVRQQTTTQRDVDEDFQNLPNDGLPLLFIGLAIVIAVGVAFYAFNPPRHMTPSEIQHSLPAQSKI